MKNRVDLCSDIPTYLCFPNDNQGHSVESPGKFTVYDISGAIIFEWKSDDFAPFNLSQYNLEQSHIFQFLHQAHSLQLIPHDDNEKLLRFTIPTIGSTIYFKFPEESGNILLSVIDTLLHRNLLIPNPQYPQFYNSISKFEKTVSVPSGSLSLTQVECLYAQRIATSKLPSLPPTDISNPFTLQDFLSHVQSDGTISDWSSIKSSVFAGGLTSEARPYVWPYLFGFFTPDMDTTAKEAALHLYHERYLLYKRQVLSYIDEQFFFDVHHQDVIKDALRTDRNNPFFRNDFSPGFVTMIRVLQTYTIYDMDTRFVQGMADFITPLLKYFVKEFHEPKNLNDPKISSLIIFLQEGNQPEKMMAETYYKTVDRVSCFLDFDVTMYDGRKLKADECESFIFWNFVHLLKLTQEDSLFGNLKDCQEFVGERAVAIASSSHILLGKWLAMNNLSDIVFLYSPFLLLYKRFLNPEMIDNVWDVFFSAEIPCAFVRFFTAAVLFYVFPDISSEKSSLLGDVQTTATMAMKTLDTKDLLTLAKQLLLKAKENPSQNKWLFMDLPSNHEPVEFVPHLFSLIKS